MYGYIYITTNTLNNKIYIGQHISSKFDFNYLGSGSVLKRAIKKHGKSHFSSLLLESCESIEDLNRKESYWISYYNSTDPTVGYNIKYGGNNTPLPERVKAKISKAQRDNPNRSMLGRLHTSAAKLKMSQSASGKAKSPAARKHMSEAKKGKPRMGGDNTGKIWVNNGVKQHLISPQYLESYLNDSYVRGRIPQTLNQKNKIKARYRSSAYIHLNDKCINVPKDRLEEYLDAGWVEGKLPYSTEHCSNISKSKKGARKIILNGKTRYVKFCTS